MPIEFDFLRKLKALLLHTVYNSRLRVTIGFVFLTYNVPFVCMLLAYEYTIETAYILRLSSNAIYRRFALFFSFSHLHSNNFMSAYIKRIV